MDSKNNDGNTTLREITDDEPTNELAALNGAAAEDTQGAVVPGDSGIDTNVLALRRVDAEIRRLMESWVDLEKQLKSRDIEISRLRDHGRSVEEQVQTGRDELAASRSDCERLRGEAAEQQARAERQALLQHEDHQKADALQLNLAAASGRIHELESQIHQGSVARDSLEAQLREHRDALTGMAAELSRFEKTCNSHDQEKATLAARIADLERRSSELTGQWLEATGANRQAGEQLQTASRRAEGLESELRQARQVVARLEKAVEEKAAVTARLGELERELAVERATGSALRTQLNSSEHAVAQVESALEHQRQRAEAAANTASRAEQLLAESRAQLSALAEVEAKAARLGAALAAAEAAAVAAAGERESLLATIAGLHERVSALDAERSQLILQLDEQRAHLSAIDSEFQTKRRSIAALSSEFDRLGLIQANVRKLDGMMSRQLAGGSTANGEDDRPRNGRLIVSLDGEKAVKYPLFKPDMVIGRSRNTDIRITGPHTSRRHARVFLDGGVVMIEDLGSLNGITVNQMKVRKHELHDGDVLDVGGARLRFVDLDEKAAGPRNGTATAH